jgi:5-methylcytosine-specific restriction endonuclease McrA
VDDYEIRGWFSVGAQSFRHHCGARVTRRGRLWTARDAAGTVVGSHLTALEAISCLEESDPSFWSYGHCSISGYLCDGVFFDLGFPDATRPNGEDGKDAAFVCRLADEAGSPDFFEAAFKKHFFGKVHCAKCLRPLAKLLTRTLVEFDGSHGTRNLYVICDCGHPVWNQNMKAFNAATQAIRTAEKSWRRNQRVELAGGSHTPTEIQAILALQDNRCIYCHAEFTSEVRPTKDHLLAIADGGGNWAQNIVMACQRCNSRRCDIPFRTYCRLLSQKQNQRILKHLGARLLASDLRAWPDGALDSFDNGLADDDIRHWRFVDIQNNSVEAHRNASRNEALPRTRSQILKKAFPSLKHLSKR